VPPRRSAAASRWTSLREDILEAAVTLNRIARGLRPPALEGVGVQAALRGHVRTRLSETDLDADVEIDPVSELLGEDEKLVLYRVVQEAITNVVRHAQASRVTLRVFEEKGTLVAEVIDDGKGFVFEEVESGTRGLGLLGMRERAGSVGGRVSVSSELGEGTRIQLELPVNVPEAMDV
jgi:signal transduction histidine kinase